MGRLFANAVKQARADNKTFSRPVLEELYERPLRETHYFKNVEFLEKWPHYVEHTRVFFGRTVDLSTGSLYIASNTSLKPRQRLWQLAKFTRETLPLKNWGEFFRDLRGQRAALGLVSVRKSLVDGISKCDPATGEILSIFVLMVSPPPIFSGQSPPFSRMHQEFFLSPLIIFIGTIICGFQKNCSSPAKLSTTQDSAVRTSSVHQFSLSAAVALLVLMPIQWICELINLAVTRPSPEKFLSGFFQKNLALVRQRLKLDPDAVKIEQSWEEKLSLIRYFSENHSHIKVFRPENFENRAKITDSPLWHVCPAKVYECRTDDLGQSQLVVNFENCIKCETCWRSAPNDVDWTRQRHQRLIFSAPTESNQKLLALMKQAGVVGCVPSRDDTAITVTKSAAHIQLSAKLHQFSDTVYAGPRYIDAGRTRWLQSLLTEAQSIAAAIKDPRIDRQIVRIITHAKRRKFFWAEADTRQLLEQLPPFPAPASETLQQARAAMVSRLDKLFPKQAIKNLEHNKPLSKEQINFLRVLADTVSPPRPVILRELARRDPSLAALVSGIYSAQVAVRPELADQPWIGLTAARSAWKEFIPELTPTLSQVAADVCAIALGAGEMLLERCRQHATSRVQFPGLLQGRRWSRRHRQVRVSEKAAE